MASQSLLEEDLSKDFRVYYSERNQLGVEEPTLGFGRLESKFVAEIVVGAKISRHSKKHSLCLVGRSFFI